MPGRVKVLLLGPGVFGRNHWNVHWCPFTDQLRYRRVHFDDVSVVCLKSPRIFKILLLNRDFCLAGGEGIIRDYGDVKFKRRFSWHSFVACNVLMISRRDTNLKPVKTYNRFQRTQKLQIKILSSLPSSQNGSHKKLFVCFPPAGLLNFEHRKMAWCIFTPSQWMLTSKCLRTTG